MSETTEKQLTAFIALIYNLNKQMLSLTAFAQTLVTENRSLKVKVDLLENEAKQDFGNRNP